MIQSFFVIQYQLKVDIEDPNAAFFLTAAGLAASVTNHTFKKFASVVGLPKASANTIRRGATTNLRKDPVMSAKEPIIMDHSAKVADHHYDQGRTVDQVSLSFIYLGFL